MYGDTTNGDTNGNAINDNDNKTSGMNNTDSDDDDTYNDGDWYGDSTITSPTIISAHTSLNV